MESTLLSTQEIMNVALAYRRSGGKFRHEESLNGPTGIAWDYQGTHYYVYCGRRGGVFVQINWTDVQQLEGTTNLSMHSSRALVRWMTKIYQTAEVSVLPKPDQPETKVMKKRAASNWRPAQGGKRMVRRITVLPTGQEIYLDVEI